MAATEDGENYNTLSGGNDDEHAKTHMYIKKGMEQYIAVLHFEGLNNMFYYDLK